MTETKHRGETPTPSRILSINGGHRALSLRSSTGAIRQEAPDRSVRSDRIGGYTLGRHRGRRRSRGRSSGRCPGSGGGGPTADRLARSLGRFRGDRRGRASGRPRGSRYHRPERVTPALIEGLRRIISYGPDHMPGEIELIEAFRERDPDLTQVACFDTAFHHDMPRVAQIVPIPKRYEAAGSAAMASMACRMSI